MLRAFQQNVLIYNSKLGFERQMLQIEIFSRASNLCLNL